LIHVLILAPYLVVHLKSIHKSLVLILYFVWEHFDSEVAHFVLSVEVLILSLHHDVVLLEQEIIKVFLNSRLIIVGLELSELLCAHSHQSGSLITSKVNVNRLSEVRDQCTEHVGWIEVGGGFVAVLALETVVVLDNLLSAGFSFAGGIEDSVIILNP
jgi:hypothetical protein